MNNYKFSFTGRQAGAIGIFYKITDTYKAKDIHHALSLLYEDYEHISGLTIYESNRGNRDFYATDLIEAPNTINWVKVESHRTRRERSPKTGVYKLYRDDAETLDKYNY